MITICIAQYDLTNFEVLRLIRNDNLLLDSMLTLDYDCGFITSFGSKFLMKDEISLELL